MELCRTQCSENQKKNFSSSKTKYFFNIFNIYIYYYILYILYIIYIIFFLIFFTQERNGRSFFLLSG
ncbi:MAG: hypothetical protein [Cotesia congregata filamentous virus 2]